MIDLTNAQIYTIYTTGQFSVVNQPRSLCRGKCTGGIATCDLASSRDIESRRNVRRACRRINFSYVTRHQHGRLVVKAMTTIPKRNVQQHDLWCGNRSAKDAFDVSGRVLSLVGIGTGRHRRDTRHREYSSTLIIESQITRCTP